MKLKKLLKEIKGVFKPPMKQYYIVKLRHGTPYFYPRNFNSTILSFRKVELSTPEELAKYPNDWIRNSNKFKGLPTVRRAKDTVFKFFNNYYWIEIGWPFMFHTTELGYKDKWNSPRYEWSPAFHILFFKWQFCIWWNAPKLSKNAIDTDRYYEQILWYLYYSDKNIKKAKESWPWQTFDTKKSSWDDEFLIFPV